MKRYCIVLATLIICSIHSLAAAVESRPGPYFSGFLGTSFTRNTTVSGYDSFNNVTFNDQVSFDPGIYVGGTGGYNFGFVRVEGELSYRQSKFDTITDAGGNRFRSVDGDLGAFATMFNVFFDMRNSSPVTPYVGGGIGFTTLHLSETTGYDNAGKLILYDDSSDTVFASQVGAGVDLAINSRYSVDIGYRYFITDKAKLSGDFISSDLRYESHNAMVGFKFKF